MKVALKRWHKQPGETFVAGEALYSIETEKTATEIEAPAAGILLEVLVKEGEDAEAGTTVCRIEVEQPK